MASMCGVSLDSEGEASPETLEVLIRHGANVIAATQDVRV